MASGVDKRLRLRLNTINDGEAFASLLCCKRGLALDDSAMLSGLVSGPTTLRITGRLIRLL